MTLNERDEEHERVLGIVFDISPAQACVLSCLCRNRVVSSDELTKYVGNVSAIKVTVSRLRSKLQSSELGIEIKSKIGVGYWLENDDREKIKAKVAGFLQEV